MNQAATQGDFWSRAHFRIMRGKVVQINGVSILMGPGKMAGWWILFAESSPVFCFSDLHPGEPKGSHWKAIASPFDRCWHKSFLFVGTSSLGLSFPPLHCLWTFLKTQLTIYVWAYFWTLFCVKLCVCPLPLLYCHFCTFIILLKSDSHFFQICSFLDCFGSSKPSTYPYKF